MLRQLSRYDATPLIYPDLLTVLEGNRDEQELKKGIENRDEIDMISSASSRFYDQNLLGVLLSPIQNSPRSYMLFCLSERI